MSFLCTLDFFGDTRLAHGGTGPRLRPRPLRLGDLMSDQKSDEKSGPILVVDDEPALRRALSRILRTHGHEVLEASDGHEALSLLREREPSLVVLDYMMPGMDGEMVLEAMRDELSGGVPPALLLTASEFAQQRAQEMGALLGLPKPFQVPELLAAVARFKRDQLPDA